MKKKMNKNIKKSLYCESIVQYRFTLSFNNDKMILLLIIAYMRGLVTYVREFVDEFGLNLFTFF